MCSVHVSLCASSLLIRVVGPPARKLQVFSAHLFPDKTESRLVLTQALVPTRLAVRRVTAASECMCVIIIEQRTPSVKKFRRHAAIGHAD